VRVTDKMIFEGANKHSSRAREEVQDAGREASTGIRVQHPWDDPAASSAVINLRSSAKRMETIGDMAQRASDELNAADQALDGMNFVLSRARELAVQFKNDTYAPADRAAAATEVEGLLAQTLSFANAKFGGRYLFAGFKDDTEPFDATQTYYGDAGIRQAEVAPGQFEDSSINGGAVFKGVGGGVDIFATLSALKTALSTNDLASLTGSISAVDGSIDQVVQGRARAGTGVNVFDTANAAAQVAVEAHSTAASKRTDADVVASATRLAYAQRALDAALTASAKTFELTLLNKLGR
jgi:flagellar hook-associated protein 3 FlgL